GTRKCYAHGDPRACDSPLRQVVQVVEVAKHPAKVLCVCSNACTERCMATQHALHRDCRTVRVVTKRPPRQLQPYSPSWPSRRLRSAADRGDRLQGEANDTVRRMSDPRPTRCSW